MPRARLRIRQFTSNIPLVTNHFLLDFALCRSDVRLDTFAYYTVEPIDGKKIQRKRIPILKSNRIYYEV